MAANLYLLVGVGAVQAARVDAALVGHDKRVHHARQRRLARAVVAQDDDVRALLNLQVNAVQHLMLAVIGEPSIANVYLSWQFTPLLLACQYPRREAVRFSAGSLP